MPTPIRVSNAVKINVIRFIDQRLLHDLLNTDTSIGIVLANDVDAIDHTIGLATIDGVDLNGLRSLDCIDATNCIGLLDVENVYVVETNDILTVAVMVTEQEYDLLAHVVGHVDFAILPTIHSSSLFGESLAANRIGESHLLDVEASSLQTGSVRATCWMSRPASASYSAM